MLLDDSNSGCRLSIDDIGFGYNGRMAKRKASKLDSGTAIRVRAGVAMPEFPDLPIGGWTGRVIESQGSGDKLRYIIEWDAETLARLPETYRQQCEAQSLSFEMACVTATDLEDPAGMP